MNLADLQEQIKDQLKATWDKIQESSAYQQALEKYEDLPSSQQRLIRIGGGILFVLFLLSPPISWLLSSQVAIEEFERKRELTRELLKVIRDSSNVPQIPQAPDLFSLQNRLQQDLLRDRLMPEQIYAIQADVSSGDLIPKNLALGALSIDLRNLNLRQVIDVGHRIVSVSPTVKMTDMEITASPGKEGYFNFKSRVVALKAPEPPQVEPEEPTDRRSKPRQRPKKSRSDEDEE